MLQQRRWARRWLYATTCDLWQPSLASSAAVEVVGRLLLSRRTPLSEHKMWLETTGREFDQEVIEQLAVTPKFVVRGEVLPSYGHRSGYCHVTPTVHCSDEAGQQFLLDQQSSHSMDRHAFLPPLGSFERQRVNQDRRTSNDEDTMCCICFPRPPLVAFMKTTPLLRRHHRQTLLLISEIFSTAF
jgi:hypothetical protein